MHLSRLRPGEVLAGLASIALLVLGFLSWFRADSQAVADALNAAPSSPGQITVVLPGVDGLDHSGWSSMGWALVVLLVLLVVGALAFVILTVIVAPVAAIVAIGVFTEAVGIIATVALLVRLTLGQPALDLGLANRAVDVLGVAWLGFAAVVLTTAGVWYALKDERTGAAYSAPPELTPRPAPTAAPQG